MQLAHHRRTGAFRGSPGDRSRGAAIVEAAFVTPVFMMMILGIIEVGLVMNDDLALANTVRAGTRVASASGADINADYGIIQAIKREAAALPDTQIKMIVIYRATRYGAAPPASCTDNLIGMKPPTGDRTADACNVYTPDAFTIPKNRWGCKTAENLDRYWCPNTRIAIRSQGPDYVGVWMKVEHRWVSQLFGSVVTLTDQSVIRMEPRTQ